MRKNEGIEDIIEENKELMKEKLIELAYNKRNIEYDIQMSKTQIKEKIEEINQRIYELNNRLYKLKAEQKEHDVSENKLEDYLIIGGEHFDSWDEQTMKDVINYISLVIFNLSVQEIALNYGSNDPKFIDSIKEYELNDISVENDYIESSINGEIEFDENLLRALIEKASNSDSISNDIIFNNKEGLLKANEITGETLYLASLAGEDAIREIISDIDSVNRILQKNIESRNFLTGEEELEVFIAQIMYFPNLYNKKEFLKIFMDNVIKVGYSTSEIKPIFLKFLDKCTNFFADKEFAEKVMDYVEKNFTSDSEIMRKMGDEIIPYVKDFDEELIFKYYSLFEQIDGIDEELINDKSFFMRLLDEGVSSNLTVPEIYSSDVEVLEKCFSFGTFESIEGLNFEALNNERIAKRIKDLLGGTPNEILLEELAKEIEYKAAVATHFGDDLDNKSAIEAITRWAEDNDLIKIGSKLEVKRFPVGQVKYGMINLDTGGYRGTRIDFGGIIIDGDIEHGVKSTCEALSRLGIYVPEQILEFADTKSNKVSALDSRSGLALVRYLDGEQIFRLAEAGLLDQSLSDEQLEEFGLIEAHSKQQKIIENAVTKIQMYTKKLSNGEKIVLAPEQITSGSSIAYEMGINYFASATRHNDENGMSDGVTFAITSKYGVELPENVLEFGRKLSEAYRIDGESSNVFVDPKKQMIVAGGPKNPNFRIAGRNVENILEDIKDVFEGKEINLYVR